MGKSFDPIGLAEQMRDAKRCSSTPRPIVSMSFQLAIPWRVALPQSPPLLHQPGASMHERAAAGQQKPANGQLCLNYLSHPRGQAHPDFPPARKSRSLSPTFHVPDFPPTFLGDGERASTGQRGVCRAIGGNFGAQIEPETHGTTQEGRRRGLARKSRSLSPTFPRLCNNSSVECSGLIDAGHRLFPRWIDATPTITKETKR